MLLFGPARDVAAGTSQADLDGATVTEVLATGAARFGAAFADLCRHAQIWVNGEPAGGATVVEATDEVAVLPPVSGG